MILVDSGQGALDSLGIKCLSLVNLGRGALDSGIVVESGQRALHPRAIATGVEGVVERGVLDSLGGVVVVVGHSARLSVAVRLVGLLRQGTRDARQELFE